MKIKVQDLKPGNICRSVYGLVTITDVNVFKEKKAPLVGVGFTDGPQPYFPACVLVRYKNNRGHEGSHTFSIDEEVDRVFSAE